jgi:hypothetical protein
MNAKFIRGNQKANGENKPQPVVSGETGLLDSIRPKSFAAFLAGFPTGVIFF